MRGKHKVLSFVFFLVGMICACTFALKTSAGVLRSMITFYSIVFGFYMTSIATLHGSFYTKHLHDYIDEKEGKRGTHILKSYLLISGYWLIFSAVATILFMSGSTQSLDVLYIDIDPVPMPFSDYQIDVSALLSSGIFGLLFLNVFYMVILLQTIANSMIQEAKKMK